MTRILLCLGLALFLLSGLAAQTTAFPVTAVVQSLPPFTPSLSDWSDPTSNRLGVTLLLNDAEEPSYQVRLRLKISGQGIELRTRQDVQARPITLNFGQPVQLTAADLRAYFEIDNLDFIGYSRQAYLENGGVPPGTYSICFEAVDYDLATEEAASREACTFVQARLLDPPVILSPLGSVSPLNPQNLVVQWQARHTASFVTNYDLEIFSIDPAGGLTPEQIFTLQQPFIESTTTGITTTVINNAFPTLAQGQDYFARVRAYDAGGSDAFKNDGFSELAFFTYGEACTPPTGLVASVGGHDNASINWQPAAGSSGYVVRLKENNDAAQWYEYESNVFSQDLSDLTADTEYLVAVQSVCRGTPGTFSESYSFKTDTLPFNPGTFECGQAVADFTAPANKTAIASLPYGTMVTIGGFQMKITNASQVFTDLWKGTGQIFVPFLGKSVNVKFSALGVNTDRYVYQGNAFASGKIQDAPGVKSPKTIAEENANEPARDFCDSLITSSTPGPGSGSGSYSIGQDAYNSSYNANYDNYNPNNTAASYLPENYSDPKNPYTEDRPFPATSLWNPYNVFSPYDPTDYTNPVNPWEAAFPYDGEAMLDKAGLPGASDFPGGTGYGAANLPLNLGVGVTPIIIDKMQFTPTVGKLWTYASTTIPIAGKSISFRGKGITFHPEGLQGASKMELANDLVFTIKKEIKMVLKKGKTTYVGFDCNGLTGIGFDMTAEFCERYMLAVDPVTGDIKPGRVKVAVTGVADDWTKVTAELNIPPFALTKLPDWHFSVTSAIIDFSDISTPANVRFPKGYQNPKLTTEGTAAAKMLGKNSPQWTGFYLGEMTVKLPKAMARDTMNPITIGAYGMLIDDSGLTLNVYGTNLIPLQRDATRSASRDTPVDDDDLIIPAGFFEGDGGFDEAANSGATPSTANNAEGGASAGSWDISLDLLGIGFQYSKFKYVRFAGKVVVPVFKDPLTYAAHIQPPSDTTRGLTFSSAYSFHVGLTDTVKFEAMGAKLELHANSKIGINYDGVRDQFFADAEFHGLASFNPAMSGAEGNTTGGAGAGAGSGTGSSAGAGSGTTASADTTKNRFNVPQIRFQDFKVQSREPYIPSIGSWSLEGDNQPSMGGFNVKFNEVGMFSKIIGPGEMEVAFGVDLELNLTPSDDWGFGAGGKAYIISQVITDPDTKRQDWTFKKVRVDKLTLDYEGPAFKLKGLIKFYENKPVWGTGFKGGISIAVDPAISAAAVVQFGNINGHRYFFADAKVAFTPGFPVAQTGMAIYGFGGGISYGMKRSGRSSQAPTTPTTPAPTTTPAPAPSPIAAAPADPELDIPAGFFEGEGGFPEDPATQPQAELPPASGLEASFTGENPANTMPPLLDIPEALGVSLSGAKYTPDTTMGLGIKALVAFGTVKPEVFNGDVMLEVVFTAAGGIATIALTGNANFMTPPKTPANPSPLPSLAAYVDIQYDFVQKALDAMLEVKVYAAEGVLRGAYPNYVAGVGTIHADNTDWWIHLGTPTRPFQLDLDVTALGNMNAPGSSSTDTSTDSDTPPAADSTANGGFNLGEIGNVGLLVSAYFDTGTQIPDFPEPPNEVKSVIDDVQRPNADDAADGGGIMAGLRYSVSMPDLRFLIFFADLNAGIGGDVMLKNYGIGARCANNADATEPIGINGWYGTGQAYAYLVGSLGLEIDFFGSPTKFEIMTVGAAAILQTRMPNPIWIKGQLAGQYSVMGGAISGRFDFEFEGGEPCDIIGASVLDGFAVIEGITPADEATDVSVFAKPQATFNFPIEGQPISYENDEGEFYYAKAFLTEFTLRDGEGNDIAGQVEWAANRRSVQIKSDDILPPNTDLTVTAQVRFKNRPQDGTDADYAWMMRSPQVYEEEEVSVTFTTGTAPNNIPEENVVYAYPARLQTNFHRDEASTGYVQLERGQDYLFLGQPNANVSADDYEQKIRFQQPGQSDVDFDITYNAGGNRVTFAIPPGLTLDAVSTYEIVNLPLRVDAAVGANVDSIREAVALQLPDGAEDNASEVIVRRFQASGVTEGLQPRTLYELPFRTSRYATFTDKINALVSDDVLGVIQLLNSVDTILMSDGTYATTSSAALYNILEQLDGPEGFDDLDLAGRPANDLPPLMTITADLSVTGGNWFGGTIRPMVYDPFPSGGIALRRDALPLGVPPVNVIRFRPSPYNASNNLTENDVLGSAYSPQTGAYRLTYELPYRGRLDYNDLKQQVVYRLANGATLGADQRIIATNPYPLITSGTYRVAFSYRLPGATTTSSTVTHDLPYTSPGTSK